MYLYLTARSEAERGLASAECLSMTGTLPDENGIALSSNDDVAFDISISAYVKTCVKVIIHANDLSDLYDQLENLNIGSEKFRVSVVKIPRSLPLNSQEVMQEIGARISGRPDLTAPRTVFLVIATPKDLWLGEVLSESARSWHEHLHKVHPYSSSLPARIARAMINLVATPGDTIIDPCCGSGTILIEATSIGVRAVGCDINPAMVSASIKNLKHFNLHAEVLIADARNIKGKFDAVVTDLPYGRNCPSNESLYHEILQNIRNLAPKSVIVTCSDISSLFSRMGYDVKNVIAVPKPSLVRYIHVADNPTYSRSNGINLIDIPCSSDKSSSRAGGLPAL